jgi:hypothetical protein
MKWSFAPTIAFFLILISNPILGVVFIAVALPVLAGLAMATLIGIPFGIDVLVFPLPALWFLGYIAAVARLGDALIGFKLWEVADHPNAPAQPAAG